MAAGARFATFTEEQVGRIPALDGWQACVGVARNLARPLRVSLPCVGMDGGRRALRAAGIE
eukprot:10779251-Alexandrium_andersonii.AAC.1